MPSYRSYVCKRCRQKFSSLTEYDAHSEARQCKPVFFECEICSFQTSTKTGLVSHKLGHLRKDIDLKCPFCAGKKRYKSEGNLKIHLRQYHSDKNVELAVRKAILENKKVMQENTPAGGVADVQSEIPPNPTSILPLLVPTAITPSTLPFDQSLLTTPPLLFQLSTLGYIQQNLQYTDNSSLNSSASMYFNL